MTRTLMAFALVVLSVCAASANPDRRAFETIRAVEEVDPERAVEDMVDLAERGFAPAMNRVGYYHRHGVGTSQDLLAARTWYQRAVAAGHPWSAAALARVEIARGDGDAALSVLEPAAHTGLPGAARLLATAHIDRAFGAASQPEVGRNMLIELYENGETQAAVDLLQRHNWKRLRGQAPDHLVNEVVLRGLKGETRAAEAALVYLTLHNDKDARITEMRRRLLSVPGLRGRIRWPQYVHLAADMRPEQFWSAAEEALNGAGSDAFARVATTVFWINKNAWVRVLQKELRDRGYYSGKAHGRMTTRTIRAQNRFCRANGIWPVCATGPLRGETVRAVATVIAVGREAF